MAENKKNNPPAEPSEEVKELTAKLETETKAREAAEAKLKKLDVGGVPKNFKGFIIEVSDPYVAGVKRFLKREHKAGDISGNLCVSYASKLAEAALNNYILRAAGSGDLKRVEWAQDELKIVKKGK